MSESEEREYVRGKESVYRELIAFGVNALSWQTNEGRVLALESEREQAIHHLRDFCETWLPGADVDPALHLGDMVEGILAALESKLEELSQ